jgi:ribokinase
MSHILISGLVNTETTVRIREFPIPYYPIDYPFFGIGTAVSGVAYNLTKALHTLGDRVTLLSMTGEDLPGEILRRELEALGVDTAHIKTCLKETPGSVVLYDGEGKRQIYCDLKDIQETDYGFAPDICRDVDLVAACNINFNRPLLHAAKAAGKTVATDVHVLRDHYDDYNREFMECADILFLSDEGIGDDYRGFVAELGRIYRNRIIVLGRGGKGAALYLPAEGQFHELPAVQVGPVVNTVGAGDALFSAFIHGYAKGLSPLDALHRAQLFASAKIGTSGASRGFLTEEKLEALYLQKK